MKQLQIKRDPGSQTTYGLEMTDKGWTARLAADTDTSLAVPAGARFALIAADDYYFVNSVAITLPTEGAGFTQTDAEHAKDVIVISGETTLHFRSRNATDISVSFWG